MINQNPQPVGSNRINQLRKLSEAIPGGNQNVANQLNATREIQLQNMIKQAPTGAPIASTAQGLGAKQAEQRGQVNLQVADQNQKDLTGLAQVGLQNQQVLASQQVGAAGRRVSERQRTIENQLASMSQDTKNKILDKQLEFKRDEAGRTFLNERQLADWAILNAKNEQDFLNYQQQMEQLSERNIKMLETAYKKIKQTLEHGYIGGKQALDNETKLRMKNAANALEEKIRKKYSDFAVRRTMFMAGGTVIGAVAGAALTWQSGGWGAVPGAAIGAGAGEMAAGAT